MVFFFFPRRLFAIYFPELLNTVTLNECLKLFCTEGMEGDKYDASFKEISEGEPSGCGAVGLCLKLDKPVETALEGEPTLGGKYAAQGRSQCGICERNHVSEMGC